MTLTSNPTLMTPTFVDASAESLTFRVPQSIYCQCVSNVWSLQKAEESFTIFYYQGYFGQDHTPFVLTFHHLAWLLILHHMEQVAG